jgi:homocysteine S-methyltransferase
LAKHPFTIAVEVVPPDGSNADPLLAALKLLANLPIDSFSVATNPVAKPRMSALALCTLIQQQTTRRATLHCTTRDHNRLSLQGLLWGARALGIETILATTGDFVALGDRGITTTVRDLDLFELIRMALDTGLQVGVALDPNPEARALRQAVDRLARKTDAGARYAVTQPIYDRATAETLAEAVRPLDIPVVMGILPLRSPRHAEFLHRKVAGILVPKALRKRMHQAAEPVREGAANARDMLSVARELFAGACVMPPFDRYEVLRDILDTNRL